MIVRAEEQVGEVDAMDRIGEVADAAPGPRDDEPTVFDPESMKWISAKEAAFRTRIARDLDDNKMAIDAYYLESKPQLHAPLETNETGSLSGDWWEIARTNRAIVRVPANRLVEAPTRDILAARIAGAALGPLAEQVMLQLFAKANENYRNPALRVELNELLDRVGFKRDRRGAHYTDSRRAISRTIIGLHFTHVGIQQTQGAGKRRRSTGFVAPLLAAVGYGETADVEGFSLQQVFEQALPEKVEILLNPAWYAGVRLPDGRPGEDFALIPLPTIEAPGRRRGRHAGGRVPVAVLLRQYIGRCREAGHVTGVTVTRAALIGAGDVRDRDSWQAGRTLGRALDALCHEGVLRGYEPVPLPTREDDRVTLVWVDIAAKDTA